MKSLWLGAAGGREQAGSRLDAGWPGGPYTPGSSRRGLFGHSPTTALLLLLRGATLGKKDDVLGVWRRLFVELLLLGVSTTGLWS